MLYGLFVTLPEYSVTYRYVMIRGHFWHTLEVICYSYILQEHAIDIIVIPYLRSFQNGLNLNADDVDTSIITTKCQLPPELCYL